VAAVEEFRSLPPSRTHSSCNRSSCLEQRHPVMGRDPTSRRTPESRYIGHISAPGRRTADPRTAMGSGDQALHAGRTSGPIYDDFVRNRPPRVVIVPLEVLFRSRILMRASFRPVSFFGAVE